MAEPRFVDTHPESQGRVRLVGPSKPLGTSETEAKTVWNQLPNEDLVRKIKNLRRKLASVKRSRDSWRKRYEEEKDPEGEVRRLENLLARAEESRWAREKPRGEYMDHWNQLKEMVTRVESVVGSCWEALREEGKRGKSFLTKETLESLNAELELVRRTLETVRSVNQELKPVRLIGNLMTTTTGFRYDVTKDNEDPDAEEFQDKWYNPDQKQTTADGKDQSKKVRFLEDEKEERTGRRRKVDPVSDDTISEESGWTSESGNSEEDEKLREDARAEAPTLRQAVAFVQSSERVKQIAMRPSARELWDLDFKKDMEPE